MKELMNFFKNSFGKEKNSRSHAIAMLVIYGIFIVVVIMVIRTTPVKEKEIAPNDSADKQEEIIDNSETENNKEDSGKKKNFDINYSYSYTITYDDEQEVYLGKKIDDKEKFSFIKNSTTLEYAILNDNYLILENGTYRITDKLDTYFKYCDVEKITSLLETLEYVEANNKYVYNIDNVKLAHAFGDTINSNNSTLNNIELEVVDDDLKSINLNLDSYISSIMGNNHTLNIKMEFANVGTTEDFEIKVG